MTGYSHALALSECGSVYAWGANTHGQLGNASKQCVSSPTIISNIGRLGNTYTSTCTCTCSYTESKKYNNITCIFVN